MTYHLGTTAAPKTYGYWRVDDPATVAKLREAGIEISELPGAEDAIATRTPSFVLVTDPGGDRIAVTARSSWGVRPGFVFSGGVAAFRAKLAKTSDVPVVPPGTIDRLSLPTSADIPPTIGGPARGAVTVGGRKVGVPVPADQASLPSSDRLQVPAVPELPPIVFDPSLERAIDRAVGRKSSNTGLYIGLGVAAVALFGLGYLAINRQKAPKPLTSNRRVIYALPERKAYPITSREDAINATKRLKQGRVRSEADANLIIAAIEREHHDIWREYLEGYPVSRIMRSKRKGLAARRRTLK
jgi:hypothetical protein